MANEKLWVATVNGVACPKPGDASRKRSDRAAQTPPQPEEGLRLISAFSQIDDPYLRAELIERAESYLKPGA